MSRAVKISAGALIAFLLILLVRFPAQWIKGFLPKDATCQELSGSVWSGSCAGLAIQGTPAGDVSWTLHPSSLFKARLGLTLAASRPPASVNGQFEIGFSGEVRGRDIVAVIPLDPAVIRELPPDLRGTLNARLDSLALKGKTLTGLEGVIDVMQLEQPPGTAIGEYRLTFPKGATGDEPTARLEDLSGPLDVEGTFRLTREPGYELQGTVVAKPEASESTVNALRYLGSPDAQGRRPFSRAGTF